MFLPVLIQLRYRATLYPCPENRQERRETLTSIDGRIHDLNQVRLNITKYIYSSKLNICNFIMLISLVLSGIARDLYSQPRAAGENWRRLGYLECTGE